MTARSLGCSTLVVFFGIVLIFLLNAFIPWLVDRIALLQAIV
jgi:hypothetical protein